MTSVQARVVIATISKLEQCKDIQIYLLFTTCIDLTQFTSSTIPIYQHNTANMSFLRTTRTVLPITRRRIALTTPQQRFATQDYGSGAGNPAGENPRDQGTSQVSRDLEHPGPEAPSTGGGGGKSSNSGSKEDQQPSQNQGNGSSSGSGEGKAQPKILNTSPPKEGEANADVEKHNREMDQRSDRATERIPDEHEQKDKVGKDFWKGESWSFLARPFPWMC